MATFKVEIPDFSSIKVGDIVEINGERHELTLISRPECKICSLSNECEHFTDMKQYNFPCGETDKAHFKKL